MLSGNGMERVKGERQWCATGKGRKKRICERKRELESHRGVGDGIERQRRRRNISNSGG
jgi:hypothetical protein